MNGSLTVALISESQYPSTNHELNVFHSFRTEKHSMFPVMNMRCSDRSLIVQ